MPEMDGLQLARMIKQSERFTNTPIVFVTATSDATEDIQRAYMEDAMDFIFLPIAPELLRVRVQALINHGLRPYRLERQLRVIEQLNISLKAARKELAALNATLEQRVTEQTAALHAREELLNLTGDIARVGGWELDIESDTLHWTRTTTAIHEVPENYVPSLEEVLNFYDPEDRPAITESVRRALEHGEPFDLELRLITAKGHHLWVRVQGQLDSREGKRPRLHGAFHDITRRKRAEQETKDQMEELLRWHDATLGRENRVLELKHEVNELLGKAGQPPRYPSAGSQDKKAE
jgi:PAS domain S-box-containing protein